MRDGSVSLNPILSLNAKPHWDRHRNRSGELFSVSTNCPSPSPNKCLKGKIHNKHYKGEVSRNIVSAGEPALDKNKTLTRRKLLK